MISTQRVNIYDELRVSYAEWLVFQMGVNCCCIAVFEYYCYAI